MIKREKAKMMKVQPNLQQGTNFLLALHAKGHIPCLKIVGIRGSLRFYVTIARSGDIERGTADLSRINLTHNLHIKSTSLTSNLKLKKTCLWLPMKKTKVKPLLPWHQMMRMFFLSIMKII